MERDFMGLISKEALAPPVKQEIPDQDPETQSPFNKNASSSHPHIMSFMGGESQGDEMKKMISDLITSSAFVASSSADDFDHDQKTSVGEFQKSPLSPSYGENYGMPTPTARQQFLGIPMTVTSPVIPIVGFTNPGNNNKPAGPAQMTIFYAGTVSVYDKMSPEMAQAILLLAGAGSSLAKVTPSPAEVAVLPNQPLSAQLGPCLKTELDFSSTKKDDEIETKTTGISSSPVCNQVPQSVVSSREPIYLPVLTPSSIPQSRRASLARFFERRKERVMSSGPYICDKKPQ